MKKLLMISVGLLLSVAMCHAQAFKIGGHGAYTVGGDVEDEEFGAGAQMVAEFNDNFSVELSGSWIEDQVNIPVVGPTDLDFFTIALSARVGGELEDGVGVYVGGGVGYHTFKISGFTDPDDEVGFHACAGAELALGDNLELFAEYRFSWVEYTAVTGGGSAQIDELPQDYNFGLARVGINLVL